MKGKFENCIEDFERDKILTLELKSVSYRSEGQNECSMSSEVYILLHVNYSISYSAIMLQTKLKWCP